MSIHHRVFTKKETINLTLERHLVISTKIGVAIVNARVVISNLKKRFFFCKTLGFTTVDDSQSGSKTI